MAKAATLDAVRDARLRRWAAYASVTVAVTLIGAKIFAFVSSNSIGVLVSLIDSFLDLLASSIILLSVMYAQRPADRSHRFGHGKAEPVAALAQSGFIAGSAIFVAIETLNRVIEPQAVGPTTPAIATLVFSIVLTSCLVAWQSWVGARTGSVAIQADRAHYVGDVLMNLAIISALFLTDFTGKSGFDTGLAAFAILYWLWNAWKIGYRAFHLLLDHEQPAEVRDRIIEIVTAHNHADDIHDLRTRSDGTTLFIEFHLEMDGEMTIAEAHHVTDALEADLIGAFPNAEIIIHQEPAGIDDERLDTRLGVDARQGRLFN
ncbi:MAG: cation diffusion facilitator family transporter [Alphaproteobacteria bacterium]|nr:cation diffusion facilitator family transporter [Alphaproteobacteria bacterium SS10]